MRVCKTAVQDVSPFFDSLLSNVHNAEMKEHRENRMLLPGATKALLDVVHYTSLMTDLKLIDNF